MVPIAFPRKTSFLQPTSPEICGFFPKVLQEPQQPGDVYIGNPAAYEHGLTYAAASWDRIQGPHGRSSRVDWPVKKWWFFHGFFVCLPCGVSHGIPKTIAFLGEVYRGFLPYDRWKPMVSCRFSLKPIDGSHRMNRSSIWHGPLIDLIAWSLAFVFGWPGVFHEKIGPGHGSKTKLGNFVDHQAIGSSILSNFTDEFRKHDTNFHKVGLSG